MLFPFVVNVKKKRKNLMESTGQRLLQYKNIYNI